MRCGGACRRPSRPESWRKCRRTQGLLWRFRLRLDSRKSGRRPDWRDAWPYSTPPLVETIIAAGAFAIVEAALPDFAEGFGFLGVGAISLAHEPEGALGRIVERDAGRIAAQKLARKAQFAVDDDVVLQVVTESDVIGGAAQPFGPVVAFGIALRGGFLEPGDGLLAVLRYGDAELIGAAE